MCILHRYRNTLSYIEQISLLECEWLFPVTISQCDIINVKY